MVISKKEADALVAAGRAEYIGATTDHLGRRALVLNNLAEQRTDHALAD